MEIPASVRERLRDLRITEPNPEVPLHVDIMDTLMRLDGAPHDVQLIALMWCYEQEEERQAEEYATAKTEYDRTLAIAVVRFRSQGEKSGEVAAHKAHAMDDEIVVTWHLRYRVAEQLIMAARNAQRILHADLSRWQTRQANERARDQFSARNDT